MRLLWINVENIDAALELVHKNNGEIIEPPYEDGPRWLATARDTRGNVIGIAKLLKILKH
jgi:predicted enzyme related to lactoylglutathione lyase